MVKVVTFNILIWSINILKQILQIKQNVTRSKMMLFKWQFLKSSFFLVCCYFFNMSNLFKNKGWIKWYLHFGYLGYSISHVTLLITSLMGKNNIQWCWSNILKVKKNLLKIVIVNNKNVLIQQFLSEIRFDHKGVCYFYIPSKSFRWTV